MGRIAGLIAAGLAVLIGGTAMLRAMPGVPASSQPTQTVSYDAGFARWLNAPRTVEMSQGVTFHQEDAILKTEAAVVLLDSQQRALNAKSQSAVHLYDPQSDLTGSEGFIDFTRHLATLRGSIVLVMKPGAREAKAPKNSLRSRFQDAATLTCEVMTYDYRKKLGRVPGSLTVRQKDRVLTADSGEYDSRAQTVTLTGNVRGHNGEGTIRAPLVTMGIQEGAEYIKIPVPVSGVFSVPQDNEETQSPPTDSRPPAKPSPRSATPGTSAKP